MTAAGPPSTPRVLVLPAGPPEDLVAALDTAIDAPWELLAPGADPTPDELHRLLAASDVVVGDWSGGWPLGKREAAAATGVRLVQQPGVGVEHVDLAAWAARGIPVANAAGTNATAVAEWCVGATLSLLRGLGWADAAVRRGEWPSPVEALPRVRELRGLRVGLVGMGAIGTACARLLAPFGCSLAYWSRHPRPPEEAAGAAYRELDDLVATSDVLVLAVALAPETRGLIDADRIARLPEGALVVNAARGPVLDEPALAAALTAGRLGGAALDVFSTEPLPADSPLRTAPNVLLSPHLGGATAAARARTIDAAAENVARAVRGDPPASVLNGVVPASTPSPNQIGSPA
ncbi:NAD(P)-dependent oxidoreductase [Trujillonella endophytica]|uniref:D-3-phosphoglycerate dehydrogenase n=1 Tax=Trujillonella endophytica TaxID=673521 RepID=A0A1H8Q4V4_9ACTN|nr:NAD(P)-dependent oxidoreductase [Trujillella endophytica]SEO49259.1 D-3-phosphoglycerate dehydrogenase [Trujillella endophytica]